MDIVFLHGINNTARTFDAVRAALPDNIPTLAPDLPALNTVDAIAEALLPSLPERCVLAGHSFGGYVALALLAAAPNKVAGLVLINSNDWADSPTAAQSREARAQEAEAGAYESLAQAATAKSFHPDSLEREDLMLGRAREVSAYGAERYAAHQRASATRPDSGPMLEYFNGPILIVTADHDEVIPTERQGDMAHRLGARQQIVPRTGHMLPAEAPEALASALADWHRLFLSATSPKGESA